VERIHNLLKRQLRRHFQSDVPPPEIESFIDAVNETYKQFDDDRSMMENTMELSSRELLQANSEMRAIFQGLPDLFFRIDPAGKILDYRGGSSQSMYVHPEKLVGKKIQDMPLPEASKKFQQAISDIARDERMVSIDYALTKDGRPNYYEARLVPLPNHQIIVAIRNITDLKMAQEALVSARDAAEEASRAKSQFLANMSHELRTPLNAIIGYSEMLQEEALVVEDPGMILDLRKIHAAGKHLLILINDILDLSKIEAGKMELTFEQCDLYPMIQDVATTILPVISKNGNRFGVQCPEDIGSIRVDITRLRQVLFNLLSNSGKFTENGTISLEVARDLVDGNEKVLFRVTDTGIGIPQEQMKKLFQPFVQADSTTTRRYGGTGLGLVVSLRFCQMMGGDITVESEAGRGSTFTVQLPGLVTELQVAAEESVRRGIVVPEWASTVLVVDDDPIVRDLLQRFLTREGFRVLSAPGGPAAIQMAKANPVDVVTLDVMMPGMDGWAVLKAFKADPQLSEIPVIMITIVDAEKMGFALGVSEYLTKPINWERLGGMLSKYRHANSGPILVVEDDEPTRELLARTLEKDGWKVCLAENGLEALERMRENVPDLILLDLMMPEMDGFQFVNHIKDEESWRSVPVIVVTAKEITVEDRERLDGFVKTILPKGGYSRDEMLQRVHDLVLQFARHAARIHG
jgi:PAS domain S-box-containing protein